MIAERLPVVLPYPTGPARTPGVHASGLIRGMAADYGILKPEWIDHDHSIVENPEASEGWWDRLEEVAKTRMLMGLAWENFYLPRIPEVIHQPGEMERDGIYLTPDGQSSEMIRTVARQITKTRHVLACHEVKVTYKSINTVGDLGTTLLEPKNWMWRMQLMSGCKLMETLIAYLHILFVCGDYRRPIVPVALLWKFIFDQQEVDQAWDRMVEYRDHRMKQQAEDALRDTEDARGE